MGHALSTRQPSTFCQQGSLSKSKANQGREKARLDVVYCDKLIGSDIISYYLSTCACEPEGYQGVLC